MSVERHGDADGIRHLVLQRSLERVEHEFDNQRRRLPYQRLFIGIERIEDVLIFGQSVARAVPPVRIDAGPDSPRDVRWIERGEILRSIGEPERSKRRLYLIVGEDSRGRAPRQDPSDNPMSQGRIPALEKANDRLHERLVTIGVGDEPVDARRSGGLRRSRERGQNPADPPQARLRMDAKKEIQ